MDPKDSPYIITILPWHHTDAGLHLSLCIDLNRKAFPAANAGLFDCWYERVRRLHADGGGLYGELRRQLKADNGVVLVGRMSGAALSARVHTCPPPCGVVDLWKRVFKADLAFQFNEPVNEGNGVLASDAGAELAADPIVRDVIDIRPTGSRVDDVVRSMLTTGPMSGVRTLRQTELLGIKRAAEDRVRANIDLVEAALKRRGIATSTSMAAAGTMEGEADVTLVLAELTSREFSGSPEYVQRIFDSLSASPKMRRLFGATIDITVPYDLASDVTLPVSLQLRAPIVSEFYVRPTPILRASLNGRLRLTVAEPKNNAALRGGVLQLKTARVMSFEAQSAASAAEDAARELVEQSAELRMREALDWSDALNALSAFKLADQRREQGRNQLTAPRVLASVAALRRAQETAAILTRTDNRLTNIPTRGLVVYHTKPSELINGLDTAEDGSDESDAMDTRGAIRGFVVYVRRAGCGPTGWMSLTSAKETFHLNGCELPPPLLGEGAEIELGIHVGGAVKAARDPYAAESRTPTQTYELRDGFILAWDGNPLSARSPLRQRERGSGATAEDDAVAAMKEYRRSMGLNELDGIAAQRAVQDEIGVEWFPFPKRPARKPTVVARRSYVRQDRNAVKLTFGADCSYQFAVVPQYHNGYTPWDCDTINSGTTCIEGATPPASFYRYDHIRDIVVSLEQEIFADAGRKTLKREHAGESERHLVVRSGETLHTRQCTRLLLPPPIPTFQTYLWYRLADLEQMGPVRKHGNARHSRALDDEGIALWYERYNCDAGSQEGFNENRNRERGRNALLGDSRARGCGRDCITFCGGLSQPPVWQGELRYLPDPVVTGIRIEFFEDATCSTPAAGYDGMDCFYRRGRYPSLNGWRLSLEKEREGRSAVEKDDDAQTLTVRVRKGRTIYARATPMHQPTRSHFAKSMMAEQALGNAMLFVHGRAIDSADLPDPLHANVTTFTLTHATQRPLIPPVIGRGARLRRFNPLSLPPADGEARAPVASKFEIDLDVTMEWLNQVRGLPDEEAAPTGELELFALWNDYSERCDGPCKSIDQKRDPSLPSGGFVRIARLRPEELMEPSTELKDAGLMSGQDDTRTVKITFRSDHAEFQTAQHTPIRFRIRNRSKFYSFFHVGTEMTEEDAELHAHWSEELILSEMAPSKSSAQQIEATFLPSNVKPDQPEIRKIVALVKRDERRDRTTYSGDRVRIYLGTRGRQSTGPDRIGVLVFNGDGSLGPFEGMLSQGGQDIVTDGPPIGLDPRDPSWLRAGALRRSGLESEYMQRFTPELETDLFAGSTPLAPGVGLVSYRPRYDDEQGLWYFDVELVLRGADGRELHNPMARLALVTYQPHGANYGPPRDAQGQIIPGRAPLTLDMRVSEVRLSEFFSIYPSRELRDAFVLFESEDDIRILSGSLSSLFFREIGGQPVLRTQFVLEVQRCGDGGIWETIPSTLASNMTTVNGVPVSDSGPAHYGPARRHLLLPDGLRPGQPGARFESRFGLRFDTGFFDSPRSGRYRVVLQEVDWYQFAEAPGMTWSAVRDQLQGRRIPGSDAVPLGRTVSQTHDLQTRQVMLMLPH